MGKMKELLIDKQDEAYNEGFQSCCYGDTLNDNPYTEENEFISLDEFWENGWRAASANGLYNSGE